MEEVTSSRKSRQSSLKGKVDNLRKDILNPKNVLMPIKNISNSLSPNSSIEKLKSPCFKATYFEQKRVISKIPRVVQRLQEMQAIHQHMKFQQRVQKEYNDLKELQGRPIINLNSK